MAVLTKFVVVLGVVLALPWAAAADTAQLMKLIGILKDNGTITAEQYDMLLAAAEEPPAAQTAPITEGDVRVRTKGGISVATYDGAFSAEIGGRLQLDGAVHQEDQNPMGDGTEIRVSMAGMSVAVGS